MPGMGGFQQPGMGGAAPSDSGMGGGAPQGGGMGPMGPWGDKFRQDQRIQKLQQKIMTLQRRCAGGDGRACNELQIQQQLLGQAQQQQQQGQRAQILGSDRGTMGVGGRGRRGTAGSPAHMQALMGSMYGGGGY